MSNLVIALGDITTVASDVIVNAANTTLQGGGGVDGAIHRAAGPGLREFNSNQLKYCPPGDLRISPALGDLQRQGILWVFNTVGPIWTGPTNRVSCARLLARCYARVLMAAHRLRAQSISMPSISTGIYGYPLDEAASIAAGQISRARSSGFTGQVILVAYDEDTHDELTRQTRSWNLHPIAATTPFVGKLRY